MAGKTIYLEHGSIWSAATGCIIENPALLIDSSSDMLLKYGEVDNVRAYYEKMLVLDIDFEANTEVVHKFIFGDVEEKEPETSKKNTKE